MLVLVLLIFLDYTPYIFATWDSFKANYDRDLSFASPMSFFCIRITLLVESRILTFSLPTCITNYFHSTLLQSSLGNAMMPSLK